MFITIIPDTVHVFYWVYTLPTFCSLKINQRFVQILNHVFQQTASNTNVCLHKLFAQIFICLEVGYRNEITQYRVCKGFIRFNWWVSLSRKLFWRNSGVRFLKKEHVFFLFNFVWFNGYNRKNTIALQIIKFIWITRTVC